MNLFISNFHLHLKWKLLFVMPCGSIVWLWSGMIMYFIKIKIDFKKVCVQAMFFLLISCTVSDVLSFFFCFPRKLSMIKVHTPLCLDLINVVKTRRYNNLTYYRTCEWIIANQAFINLCHLPWYWQKIPALLTKGIEGTLLAAYCFAMK